jgi:hypothetical protein
MTQSTINHRTIRDWIEKHGGTPALKESTSFPQLSVGVIFPDQSNDEGLVPISWEEFFKIFDSVPLVFMYDEASAESRFNEFVHPAELEYA